MEKPDLDPRRSAEALYADIEQYITEATRRMDAGEFVSLAELDVSVDALCNRVLNLRADEAQHFIERLEALRNKLDTLQTSMQSSKETLHDQINASSQRQKASRAYRNPLEDKS